VSDHNDDDKHNVTVHINKEVSNDTRVKRIVDLFINFLLLYAIIRHFSGDSNIVLNIIIIVTFLYHIVDNIIYRKSRKRQVTFEKNDEKALS
jgi:uncharacterized protein YhhL (DUF1145 family)